MQIKTPIRQIALGLLVAGPLTAQQDHAVLVTQAVAGGGGLTFGPAPAFQHHEPPCPCVFSIERGTASSDSGRIQLQASFQVQTSAGQFQGLNSTGSYRLQDLVFSSPAGVTSTNVTVLLSLHDVTQGGAGGGSRLNSISLYAQVGGTGQWGEAGQLNNVPNASSGPLAGYAWGDAVVAFGPFSVPTNVPVLFRIEARAQALATAWTLAHIQCSVALGDGYTDLGSTYPVFDLEPGITANSVSGNIVDNQWAPATEVGFRFCEPLAANSSGTEAWIHALGSDETAANNTTLVVTGLPTAGTTAMLVNSRQATTTVSNPGASDGRLCIASLMMGRHSASIYMGTAGTFSVPLDLTALPYSGSPSSSVAAVVAGETWYWQCWYRDSTLGPGRSNFSGAIGIHFE